MKGNLACQMVQAPATHCMASENRMPTMAVDPKGEDASTQTQSKIIVISLEFTGREISYYKHKMNGYTCRVKQSWYSVCVCQIQLITSVRKAISH